MAFFAEIRFARVVNYRSWRKCDRRSGVDEEIFFPRNRLVTSTVVLFCV